MFHNDCGAKTPLVQCPIDVAGPKEISIGKLGPSAHPNAAAPPQMQKVGPSRQDRLRPRYSARRDAAPARASAASGHAAATPPRSVINERRFIPSACSAGMERKRKGYTRAIGSQPGKLDCTTPRTADRTRQQDGCRVKLPRHCFRKL